MHQRFRELYDHITNRLQRELAPYLQYHSVTHTLDVLEQAACIASRESLENHEDAELLKISCLYHDSGFLSVYSGHEEESCAIASSELPSYGLTAAQIDTICGLIRATRVPQQPLGALQEVICDADLDYLGRNDFFEKGNLLYKEYLVEGIVNNVEEWNLLQIRFLENHHYFTKTSRTLREKRKLVHLNMLRSQAGVSTI